MFEKKQVNKQEKEKRIKAYAEREGGEEKWQQTVNIIWVSC